ncbi:hypothetical protein HanIR_Chr07g0304971 [Helianthus annuus]|nr:hypothetical protein HanIR_Chr07g0304971 [Helianthus annuus]
MREKHELFQNKNITQPSSNFKPLQLSLCAATSQSTLKIQMTLLLLSHFFSNLKP